MKRIAKGLFLITVLMVASATNSVAQQSSEANSAAANSPPSSPTTPVPRLVRFSGSIKDVSGKPVTGVAGVTFGLYKEQEGGAALWTETQNVHLDSSGHYTVMLGTSKPDGLPTELFTSGEARWLGVTPEGLAEQPRVLLLSVPYALKAVDAETVGGFPPSAFVLAAPLNSSNGYARSPSDSNSAPSSGLAAGSITGTGTTDFVPLWTSSSNLGNSVLFQSGSGPTGKVGINTTTPAATLDVKGGTNIQGLLNLPATGTATSSAGKNSQAQDFVASSFSSSTGKPINQTFQWRAEPAGNNTSTPSGTLNLLFGSGTSSPTETGVRISSKGLFTFAAGQTFPGTGTITGVTAGTDLTGGGTSGNVTLKLDTTKVPLLNAANTFVGNQAITGNLSDTGNISATGSVTGQTGSFAANNSTEALSLTQSGSGSGLLSTSNSGVAVFGASFGASGATIGVEGATASPSGTGVYGQGNTGVTGNAPNNLGTGIFGLASGAQGVGVFGLGQGSGGLGVSGHSDVADGVGVYGSNSSGGYGGLFSSGHGTAGSLEIGAYGVAVNDNSQALGFYGVSVIGSFEFGAHAIPGAGVWGDAGLGGGYSAIVGTSDDTNAGLFYNNSASGWTTLYAQNDESSNPGNHVLEAYGSAFGGRCYIDVIGNLVCTGTKSAVVPVDGGTRKVALYAVESPENWFEDFGSGKLTNGVAVVTLEPTFAQTVNAATNYHVFLTPNGECNGLAVTQKTATSFEVHELHGGGSDVEFDYRIVARRKGYENIRLADKTKQLESPRIAERKPGERRMPTLPTLPPMPRQMEPPTRVPIAQSSTPNQGGQPLK